MNEFTMITAIVMFALIAGAFKNYLKYKPARSDLNKDHWMGMIAESDNQHKKKIAQLEERIRVLERIVTDKNYDLKKELDKLDMA